MKIPQNLAEILTQWRSPLYLTMLVSNCVFASRAVSKGLKILRFFNLLSLVYKWQQRACFWEGNFKKITECAAVAFTSNIGRYVALTSMNLIAPGQHDSCLSQKQLHLKQILLHIKCEITVQFFSNTVRSFSHSSN